MLCKALLDGCSWETLPHKSPFYDRAIRTCNELNLPLNNSNEDFIHFIFPPWFDPQTFINTIFIQTKKSDMGEEQVQQIFSFMKFNDFKDFVKIYSDGSKQPNGTVGAAIFVDDISSTFSWRLDSAHSILTAELFAILQGLLFAIVHLKNQDIVIFTDSLSALLGIQNPDKKGINQLVSLILRQIYLLLSNKVKVVLQWIPSHKGIVGNNIVDQVAKNACSYETLTNVQLGYKDASRLINESIYSARSNYWDQVKHGLHFYKSVQNIKQYEWISLNNRAFDVLLARLRCGCADLNEFLFNIKKRYSPYCDHCANERETVEHFALQCQNNTNARETLVNKLITLNVGPTDVNLQILLTGGPFSLKKRLKILTLFMEFIKESKRFDL